MHLRVNIYIASVSRAAVLVCLLAVIGSAAVPTLVNYQGFLRDVNGDPVNVPVNVTFKIYDELDNVVWTETQNSVPVTEGSFNVLLGMNTPIDAGDFSGTERYLGLSINGDPEMIPRTRLVSQPYAFRLETVDGATGGMISGDLAVSGGNVELDLSSATAGNILKGGSPFIHNFGEANVFVGLDAGNLTTTGSGNTAIGVSALPRNADGGENTAVGNRAMEFNTSGYANTAIGHIALTENSAGSGNTAAGFGALQSNSTGWENTAVGVNALVYSTTGHFNTACGTNALVENQTGDSNSAMGHTALYLNRTGSANTASGYSALRSNTTGDHNTALGYTADVTADNLTNATAIGAYAMVDASNKIRLGSPAVTVLECQVGLTVISDKTQKENFRPVDGNEVLKKIRGLNLSSWNLIGHDPQQFRHYGPVAQEFFAAFGHDGMGTIGTPTTINSADMAGILMAAVQALGKANEELRAHVAELREMISEMK